MSAAVLLKFDAEDSAAVQARRALLNAVNAIEERDYLDAISMVQSIVGSLTKAASFARESCYHKNKRLTICKRCGKLAT